MKPVFEGRDRCCAGCRNDQPAAQPVKCAHHRDLLRSSGGWDAEIGAALGPGARPIRMRQRLTLGGEQENDIAGLSLGFAQFEPQTDTIDLIRDFVAPSRVPRPPEAKSR
jgi:hypothetical protein